MPGCEHMSRVALRGSSLIEVAVALLLASAGTVGLVGLQISAKSLGHQALQRSAAVSLASDLLERMRANRIGLPAYSLAGGTLLTKPPVDCNQSLCSADELGAWDLWTWQRALYGAGQASSARSLVNPTACVSIRDRMATVEIAWEGGLDFEGEAAESACGMGFYGPGNARRQLVGLISYVSED